MKFLKTNTIKFTIGFFVTSSSSVYALPAVLKIDSVRDLNKKELEYFPEKIPSGCRPVLVSVYVNDEMVKNIKSETGFKNDSFFKKELTGNKITYTYFPKNCPMKKDTDKNSSFYKIKNEIENWIPFHKNTKALENKWLKTFPMNL